MYHSPPGYYFGQEQPSRNGIQDFSGERGVLGRGTRVRVGDVFVAIEGNGAIVDCLLVWLIDLFFCHQRRGGKLPSRGRYAMSIRSIAPH